ncbi:RNA-dependent RNA polymerase [Bactrocera dorsalis toti-like virus 1]|uniref:RNA-directed RNA polymerase n=1 Tax=Bactrocera dorsalis toti-like virus 1 TaxID=2760897 RepID=A0A7G4YW91_9VIRU|nr:RNA-dependent RNA polymerase [Bactrocera dorsalis toti-like virus 1]
MWPEPGQALYPSVVNTDFPSLPDLGPKDLRRSGKDVSKLSRFTVTPPNWWPLSRTNPGYSSIYVYYLAIKSTGQTNTCRDLVKILSIIQKKFTVFSRAVANPLEYEGDFTRKALKSLSSQSYVKVFSSGIQYMPFVHIHQLLACAPYYAADIERDIDLWVSDHIDGKEKQLSPAFLTQVMKDVMVTWGPKKRKALSFGEYCNDFLRWGTSGGAPKTELHGSKHRTKWAFAYHHSTKDGKLREKYDIYGEALKTNKVATVALKEEAAKTREVITTPMPSYLRQSYLLWRNGNARLPCPAVDPHFLSTFEFANANWYGCIDAERFDHSVPMSAVIELLDQLGNVDEETRKCADEEIESIKSLRVEWNKKQWRYKGGLLSGWRITSILGSIISFAAAKFVQKLHPHTPFEIGIMGDDLVLYSMTSSLSIETLVSSYNAFGLHSNTSKTVSGPVGEFLRKTRSRGGSMGFPALGVKSIVYANPWITSYAYERELEVADSWMRLASRLIPHETKNSNLREKIISMCVSQLNSQFGSLDWYSWLRTPVSAGGGGCQEIASDPRQWVCLKYKYSSLSQRISEWLPTRMGILKRTLVQVGKPTLLPFSQHLIADVIKNMKKLRTVRAPVTVRDDRSITKLVFSILESKTAPKRAWISEHLNNPLPPYARTASKTAICEMFLRPPSKTNVVTSILHTKEMQSSMNTLGEFYLKYYNLLKPKKINELAPAATLYFNHYHGQSYLPYGTW